MRVTRNGLLDLFVQQAATNGARLARATEVATTGLLVTRPSDAPESMREIHQMSAAANSQVLYGENASSVGSHLQAMDDALARTHDILVRLRELAVAMASETADADGRAVAAREVEGLQTSLLEAANAQYNGRYLFAGELYDAPAFDAAFTYQGDANVPDARVSENRYIRTGAVGSEVFQGTTDIFATTSALLLALQTNDPTAVSATLNSIDDGTAQISEWRGVIGSDQYAAEDLQSVAESMNVLFSDRLSTLIEADPVAAYTELGAAQSAYEATLQVAASASTRSLFDLLA
jgi:flagellar hook-associated protein 3 FlgL